MRFDHRFLIVEKRDSAVHANFDFTVCIHAKNNWYAWKNSLSESRVKVKTMCVSKAFVNVPTKNAASLSPRQTDTIRQLKPSVQTASIK